jgi:hypothetical protein
LGASRRLPRVILSIPAPTPRRISLRMIMRSAMPIILSAFIAISVCYSSPV